MNTLFSSICRYFFLALITQCSFGSTIVPLEINDGGYIFLTVTINGNTNAKFMLDTGAGVNVMSEKLFEKIRSTLKEEGLHTGTRHDGEQITGMLYRVDDLSIGDYSQRNVAIGVYDGIREVDRLLSLDYFRNSPFTIDFMKKQLTVEDSDDLRGMRKNGVSIPLKLQTKGKHEIEFFVALCFDNDVSCWAEFDTGAGFNMLMLHPSYIEKLNVKVPLQKTNYGYYLFSTTLPTLAYCANKKKLFSENVFVGFKEGLIYEGLVGSGIFRTKRLTINVPGAEMVAH